MGGLTIRNSNLDQANLVQDLKAHQESVVDEVKDHVTATGVQTLKALNLVENEENQNPNTDYLTSQNGYENPSS